jgi:hypothetical protein
MCPSIILGGDVSEVGLTMTVNIRKHLVRLSLPSDSMTQPWPIIHLHTPSGMLD